MESTAPMWCNRGPQIRVPAHGPVDAAIPGTPAVANHANGGNYPIVARCTPATFPADYVAMIAPLQQVRLFRYLTLFVNGQASSGRYQ